MKTSKANKDEENALSYNLRKADLVNLIIIGVLVALVIEQAFLRKEDVVTVMIEALPVAILVYILYRLNFNRFIKSLLFGIIPAVAVSFEIVVNPFSVDRHYMLLMTIIVIALYFNKKLLLVYGGFINLLYIGLYILVPENFVGDNNGVAFFLSIFFMLNGELVMMYFLTKWGSGIIDNIKKNNLKTEELFDQLQQTSALDKKQMEYQKSEVGKLLFSLERLSMGQLTCDLKVDQPEESLAEEYQTFLTISEKLHESVKNINTYIFEIKKVLEEISKGNLEIEIITEYKGDFVELKDAINGIVISLNGVMGEINAAAQQVSAGTSQVSEGSQAISQGATEQAAAIEELTAAVTQIAAQTRQNALSAGKANEMSEQAKEQAISGNDQMKSLQQAMSEINVSSANISKIIKVIDDIAFQTNILALNAAVEAARAGIHGKGFAVVAEEVRNLAARSAAAAKETTELIEGSIRKTDIGTKIADETAVSLAHIVDGVQKAVDLVSQIAEASNQQASAVGHVNMGIEQMSQVVQTNSATSQQTAAAAEELSSQAVMLKDMVGKFTLK